MRKKKKSTNKRKRTAQTEQVPDFILRQAQNIRDHARREFEDRFGKITKDPFD